MHKVEVPLMLVKKSQRNSSLNAVWFVDRILLVREPHLLENLQYIFRTLLGKKTTRNTNATFFISQNNKAVLMC